MALLARFYELNGAHCRGRITIDGIDIAQVDPLALRSLIGTVGFVATRACPKDREIDREIDR